jgi:hypothetical protein
MPFLQLLQHSNSSQKNFRPIAAPVNKLDHLNSFHPEFFGASTTQAAVQA